jgi:hypothetical protein
MYACASEADGIISIRSAPGGISFSGSLFRASHGFAAAQETVRVLVRSWNGRAAPRRWA